MVLAVRKQFLGENQKNVKAAYNIWKNQKNHVENPRILNAAWNWINITIPVISSTFTSFERMMKHIGSGVLGAMYLSMKPVRYCPKLPSVPFGAAARL
ncbi:hypothetical protein ACE418_08500 [Megasphaera sp. WILCCON 0056]|uniref:hypothetical protein n=1 Tax=Megasphaera sp. WILCCON 0056 TaxID=3345340 RepID=UPI003A811C88